MSLETSIDALTTVCREILAELRARPAAACEETAPAEQTTKTEPAPAPAKVPDPIPAPAEYADVMSADEFNTIAFNASQLLKNVYGAPALQKLKDILAPYGVKSLGQVPAEHRRNVIEAINNALAEAEHGR